VTTAVAIKLLAVLLTAALGCAAGRSRLLTTGAAGSDAARVLSNAALYVFVRPCSSARPSASTGGKLREIRAVILNAKRRRHGLDGSALGGAYHAVMMPVIVVR
jgi:hypothetical protein